MNGIIQVTFQTYDTRFIEFFLIFNQNPTRIKTINFRIHTLGQWQRPHYIYNRQTHLTQAQTDWIFLSQCTTHIEFYNNEHIYFRAFFKPTLYSTQDEHLEMLVDLPFLLLLCLQKVSLKIKEKKEKLIRCKSFGKCKSSESIIPKR